MINSGSIGLDLLQKHLSIITLDENLQPPPTHKEYLSTSLRMNEKLLRMSLPIYPNLGVLTGKMSMNLFVIRAQSMRSLQDLGATFSEKLKWVSRCGNTYFAWFLCWDGIVTNSIDKYDVDVLGNKHIVIVPGSKLPDGSYSEWIKYEGVFPPTIDQSDFKQSTLQGIRIRKQDATNVQEQIKTYVYAGSDRTRPSVTDKLILFSELYNFGDGKTGANKRLLFRALIYRAIKASWNDFRATARELELVIPVSRKSITKYLDEFCKKGLIKEIACTKFGKRYAFILSERINPKVQNIKHDTIVTTIANHDIWSSSGFGTTGKIILEKMLGQSENHDLDISTIAQLTGLSRETVGRKLKLMGTYRLVNNSGRSWYVDKTQFDVDNLNLISQELGISGFFSKRKDQVDNERLEYLIGQVVSNDRKTSSVNNSSSQ